MNWQQVLEDKSLQDLPYKIELNKQGQIVMSPVKFRHSFDQGQIIALLQKLRPEGYALSEVAIETSDNVKAADAAWISRERHAKVKDTLACSIAPEICVEVHSESNTFKEMMFKRSLYFERGALEFWLCDMDGNITFYDQTGQLEKSKLIPEFPSKI